MNYDYFVRVFSIKSTSHCQNAGYAANMPISIISSSFENAVEMLQLEKRFSFVSFHFFVFRN